MDTLPNKDTFEMIQSLSYEKIVNLSNSQTRLILPCLVRMSLCDTLDVSKRWVNERKRLKLKLLGFVEVNELRNLLDFNFGELEVEVKKEMQLRSKTIADVTTSSILLAEVPQCHSGGLMKAFEAVDPKIRIKIVLSELIQLINAVRNSQGFINEPYTSELFDSEIYFFDILDLLYFSISEMPNTFQLIEVVEALLLLKKGLNMICCLIANFPESFHEICMSLITNGSNTEDESFHSANRVRVLRKLCQMNPNEALLIRGEAVELCRMPNLVVMLTLDHIKQCEVVASTTPVAKGSKKNAPSTNNSNLSNSKADVVSFITGILLSNDDRVRNWFANYIKSSQRKSSSGSTSIFGNSFLDFRAVLLSRFKAVTEQVAALSESTSSTSTESELILTEACIMLRLYCALRGAASIKYTDEETVAICRMIICRPRHGYIGVRFVSFGLCMILAFPQMVTACESESKVIDWIRWLVQEESYLGKVSGIKSSFGEMLLLIAIHFHSNQISAIGELVSSTIGIKLPIRINDLNRIKNIFTSDIFTEQTVAAHAVKVPVTRRLNSTVSGFLPVHCIYQLLKSRAFTKNKVPIKDWIFKQIRNSVPPIHPILPQLIEAYVNSILIPNTASFHLTNEPINEADMSSIFNVLVYNVSADEEEEDEEEEEEDNDDEEMDTEDDEESKEETDEEGDTSAGSKSSLKTVETDEDKIADVMASQILLLYYVLLYEDVRLANMKMILSQDRKVLKYSEEFISQLPIFYLVQKTRANQSQFGVLMPPLLRLISYHYPHLCLVKDWLPSTAGVGGKRRIFDAKKNLSVRAEIARFQKAFETGKSKASKSPSPTTMNDALERLLHLPDEYLWPLASEFVPKLRILLEENIPRVLAMNAKAVWFRLNAIFPTKLWLMTVNELAAENPGDAIGKSYNVAKKWSDMVSQPLGVFDADRRVFSCPELMEILLHTLSAFLSAARIGQVHFIMEHSRNAEEEKKRDELNVTLQSLTESAAIQLLLECCLMREGKTATSGTSGKVEVAEEDSEGSEEDESMDVDRRSSAAPTKMLSNLKEVQALICSHIHQCFIADVNLAKLVHFQGYRRELLPMVVAGIPSMHVCLDYIPELLDQHELEKQSFAIDLCSHLCQEYPIQRFFHVSKLCLAVANTHLTVLPSVRRADFYLDIIPPLQRICAVFPPLIEDFVKLLVALAQKNDSRICALPTVQCFNTLEAFTLSSGVEGSQPMELVEMDWTQFERKITSKMVAEEALSLTIHKAFGMLCGLGILEKVFKEEVVSG